MISSQNHQHQARYDQEGNIILPFDDVNVASHVQSKPQPIKRQRAERRRLLPAMNELRSFAKSIKKFWTQKSVEVFDETKNQYKVSAVEAKQHATQVQQGTQSALGALWAFLTQPVWILKPNRKPKQYSRATLFTLDVVRFGGTFAFIFFGLFAALNFESFGQILSEKVNPVQQAHLELKQTVMLDSTLRDKLKNSPNLAVAGQDKGTLIAHLPDVGPPENRIVIPKLGLNIPLVTPSYQSLLDENWDQVEHDIQQALEMGVIHYPGTARPGQAGNFFVTGHSSYYPWAPGKYKTVFARLHNLDVGDEYFVFYGGDKFRYIITSKKEVKPSNVDVLDQPLNRRMATLMTCSPVGTTLRRLVLKAQEVDLATGKPMDVGEKAERELIKVAPAMLPI